MDSHRSPGVLDCDSMKGVFVAWNDYSLAVGLPPETTLLHVGGPGGIHPIRALGLASQDDSVARWRVQQNQGTQRVWPQSHSK